jgi:hypothetical protein
MVDAMSPWQLPALDGPGAEGAPPLLARGFRPPKPLKPGTKYGKLTVVGAAITRGGIVRGKWRNRSYYEVVCDCGNTREVARDNLANGLSQSCGCGKGPQRGDLSNKKYNAGVER